MPPDGEVHHTAEMPRHPGGQLLDLLEVEQRPLLAACLSGPRDAAGIAREGVIGPSGRVAWQ
jgi:hypothetical protein